MPPMESWEAVEAFLDSETIAVLSTHNADGTIHSAPILYRYADGVFHLGTQLGARRLANLDRDPTATLLIERRTDPFKFALVYGTAEIVTGDVLEGRVQIMKRHYPEAGARAFAEQMQEQFGIVEIRFTPDRYVTVDYSRGGAS